MSTIADRLKNLYDSMVLATNVTNEFVEALPDCYEAVEEKGGTLPAEQTAANLAQAILDIPATGLPTDGSTFVSGADEGSFATPIANDGIINFIDHSTISITACGFLRYLKNIKSVVMTELTTISPYYNYTIFPPTLKSLILPKCTTISGTFDRRYGLFDFNNTIEEVEFGAVHFVSYSSIFGLAGMSSGLYMDNLKDLRLAQGWDITTNVQLNLSTWRVNNITSAEDIATLNSNIVNHLVNTYGGSGATVTLHSSLISKLTQDTLDAFAAKNLTIAAAS